MPDLDSLWRAAAGAGYLRACRDVSSGVEGDAGEKHGASAGSSDDLGRQVEALRVWAVANGRVIAYASLPLLNKGGREHYIVDPVETCGHIFKVTIGPEFGYYPCCFPNQQWRDVCNWFSTRKATPLEYFERLLLLNELFPRGDTQLLGFTDRHESLHAVTAQLIARGRPAAIGEMVAWLTGEGFTFISLATWFRAADGVALFDVLDKNVMLCDDGAMVPFDVIPIRCEGDFLTMMRAAEARMKG